MKSITYIYRIVFMFIIFGISSAEAQERIAEQAHQIFQAHCMTCHGEQGTFKETLLIDRESLIESGTVVPGIRWVPSSIVGSPKTRSSNRRCR